jgi:hypothetical protein
MTMTTASEQRGTGAQIYDTDRPNGPVAAALLAGGVGFAALGITTTLAEAVPSISAAFNWYNPVGPLTGKVLVALVIYFLSWIALHAAWRGKEVNFPPIATLAFVLAMVGLLGTFPPVFELIAGK